MSEHTCRCWWRTSPGVLAQRGSNLFARRGFNIHSLAVGTTERPAGPA